jgi:hypothetical protein
MDCSEARTSLPEYVWRRLPDAGATALRRHLGDCAACRIALDAELVISAALRNDAIVPPPRLLAGVMAGVRAEPRRAPRFALRPLDIALAAGLALAVAGLAFGLLWLLAVLPPAGAPVLDALSVFDADVVSPQTLVLTIWLSGGVILSLTLGALLLFARETFPSG